ncbi:MAG: 50S ribosomal protein L29 [SAR324 cluster bacterium]|nr:50S ribosomal protein L29 [SAR324 cluster bacterium]
MKVNELRALSSEELESKVLEMEEEQLRRRCNQVISQLPNVRLLRQGRRDIAQVKTIINEKKREQKEATA